MKLSLDWLNRYLNEPVTAQQAARLLAVQGFPIESIESAGSDTVIDAEVTSNRSDCLGHLGMAREVAAGAGRQLVEPAMDLPKSGGPGADEQTVDSLTQVQNHEHDLCPLYTARVIRGVRIGPSPAWLVQHLEAIGLRSVNNVVDVTNYVLMELGQPLHAFDLGRLAGKRIVVRRAEKNEPFTAIDGSRHTLAEHMLVIADAQRPVAIAGVMGGLDTEVTEATTDILLESACFDPLSVRRTSRQLKLSSDSSYRFERGVDPQGIERASTRAASLILELAGGTLAQGIIRAGRPPAGARTVTMRVERCNQVLGLQLTAQRMVDLLDALKLSPMLDEQDEAIITCTVPTFRLDVHREIDLIEEVGRLHGFEHVPIQDRITIEARRTQHSVQAMRHLRQVMVGHGYHETITFSFVRPKLGQPFVDEGFAPLMIDDERRKAEPMLRPSLIPSLLICRKSNQDVGNAGVRLFETAATWMRQRGAIIERRRLAMLADISAADQKEQGLRDLRGTIEELIERLGGDLPLQFEPADRPGTDAAARVLIGAVPIGELMLPDRQTLDLFDLQLPVVVAEFDLEAVLELYPPTRQVSSLARFPGIERDLSIVVDEQVSWSQIEQAVRAVNPPLLETLRFLTAYRGKPIAKGQKSVSFRMVFRDPNRTLRHDQVDPQVAAVIERLAGDVQAQLRQ